MNQTTERKVFYVEVPGTMTERQIQDVIRAFNDSEHRINITGYAEDLDSE